LGWFGFNGGSQLALGTLDDSVSVSTIFLNTNLAACGGVMVAAFITRFLHGKTDVIQMLNGAIAGLVSITAGPDTPSPFAAILIGGVGGVIVVYGTQLLYKFKIDDVVGAIPAHLFAGIWGTLAVPLTNSDVTFSSQLLGIISINVFVLAVSFIVWIAMKHTIGIRLSAKAERLGTDVSEVGVVAYAIRD
jgi:Amt family ammonium transporter